MILILDNYDSFTFNLVQYIGEIDPDLRVLRNDEATVGEVLALKPSHIVISPGPCTPMEAGISVSLIQKVPTTIPLLGVCLGHQAIGAAFAGQVVRAPVPMHGKTALIENNGADLFKGLPSTLTATRYHSLIVSENGFPQELEITATCLDAGALAQGEAKASTVNKTTQPLTTGPSMLPPGHLVMALRHRHRPIFGLQFHPESILTEYGKRMIQNFLDMKGI